MGKLNRIKQKVLTVKDAIKLTDKWKNDHKTIVFTNGCFDILHIGHVTYLAKAAEFGDYLIVGLNNDSSVKRQNKGLNRPVNDEQSRALVLASLEAVDFVIIFDEDTPMNLIKLIKPSVLVKGGDYDEDEVNETHPRYIVGSKEIKNNGGKVYTIDLVEGFSTTKLIEKLKK